MWIPATFAILIAAPVCLSRHLDHSSSKKATRRHEDSRTDDDSSWGFPKSHLRLHAKPPRVLHAKEGSSEVLECQAGGSPLPRIYWLKGGEQVSQIYLEDEMELKDAVDSPLKLNIGSTSSRLYLDCLSMADEGEYTCIAENANHRESTTTQLSVASSDERGCRNKNQFGQAPRIVTWTKTVLENQGQDARIVCRTEGDPKPTVKWLNPHGDEIDADSSSKYDVLSNGDLTIRNLKWKDMGNYICVAENSHGTARAEVFLYPAAPEV